MTPSHVVAILATAALALPALATAPSSAAHSAASALALSPPTAQSSTDDVASERLDGAHRYSTAAAVSAKWQSADTVYITSAGIQESLLASVQATTASSPLLYTKPTLLPAATEKALRRLSPRQIIVVGPSSTVSDGVLRDLREIAPTARAWEGDIFATAASMTSKSSRQLETVYLVSPSSADAYSAAATAAAGESDVLLTPTDRLNQHTAELLRDHAPRHLVVVGGTVAVQDSVARAAASAAGLSTFERVAGADRFQTATRLADHMPEWSSALISNGDTPIDAFVAAPLAATYGAPVILTRSSSAPSTSANAMRRHAPSSLTAVGGTGVVDNPTFAALIRSAGAGSEDPPEEPGWGAPAWSDEFNGSSVDRSKWTIRDQTYVGYDWSIISEDAVSVQNGMLRIRMTELTEPVVKRDGRQRYWQTGYIDTIGHHEARYGRWEIRAKVPTQEGDSRGVWPAFWLRNSDVGEIDIFEAWGGPEIRPRKASLHNTSRFTVHESTNHTGDAKGWEYEHQLWPGRAPYSTPEDFHVWAVEYTPTSLKAYFDGELAVHITPTGEQVSGVRHDFSWVWGETFQSPWNMRLNMQMGNDYGTPGLTPSPHSVMPADYLVDYVRFYEFDQ